MLASQLISKVGIDTSDLLPQIQAANAAIGQGITQATQAAQTGVNSLGGSFDVLSATEARAEQQAIRTAQAQARAMAAEGDRAGGARVLQQALDGSRGVSDQLTYSVQAQISNLERGASAAQQYGQAFQQGLLNIVGPAAVATAAIGAVVGVANSFKEAFTFDAQLGANTKAIEVQLRGVRDSGQAFQEARRYADTYKLTQQEVNEAMIASVPVIRNSTSSMEDILGVFDRLQIRQPGKTFQDAARAIGELQAGQAVSIEHIFNVPADDANRMKKEIQEGGDAVQILSQYLTDSGIGMDALKSKTEGAMGALKDYTKAQEGLKIAEGQFATGPGIGLLGGASAAIQDVTKVLGGDGLGGALRNAASLALANAAAMQTFTVELARTRDTERAVAEAAAVRSAIYARATSATDQTADASARADARMGDLSGTMYGAGRAAKELSEQELTKLQKALDDTGQRASDTYTKLQTAGDSYRASEDAAAAAHTAKLQDIDANDYDRRTSLFEAYWGQRQKSNDNFQRQQEQTARDQGIAARRAEADLADSIAKARASAAENDAKAYQSQVQQTLNGRRDLNRQIAAMEQDAAAKHAEQAQTEAVREQTYQQQVSDLEAKAQVQRAEQQQQYQEKVVALAQRGADLIVASQEAAARRLSDLARTDQRQAEDAQTRSSDQAEDRQRADEDRAQAHADRLSAIQEKASGSTSGGRITTLTGGRFTTADVAGATSGGQSVESQIAAENAKYAAQVAAAERSQALTDSRAARDAERARQRQTDDRALQETDAQAQLAQQQRALAAQQQQLDQAYAAQQAKAQATQAASLAQAQQQYDTQTVAIETQTVKEAQALDRQIAQARAAQVVRESDAADSANRERAGRDAALAQQIAGMEASYDKQHQRTLEDQTRQRRDAENAHARQLSDQLIAYQQQLDAQTIAAQKQRDTENESYLQSERARAVAYGKQKQQLETALGEQLTAYTEAQKNIGQITTLEATRREGIIAASFGRQAEAQRQAFNAAFGDLTGPAALAARQESLAATKDAGLIGGGGGLTINGGLTLNGIQNTRQLLDELRKLAIADVRNNGGNASTYWGGK